LLDYDIVDLMATLPQEVRRNFLFHRAVERAYPTTFGIPRASSSGYQFNLTEAVRTHADALVDMINGTESRLDELVPPEVLIALVDRVRRDNAPAAKLRRRSQRIAQQVGDGLTHLLSGPAAPARTIKAPRVIRNLLVLREALTRRTTD